MNKKRLKKGLLYLITALFLPTFFSWLYENFIFLVENTRLKWVFIVVFFLLCVASILLFELIELVWKSAKGKSCIEMLKAIDSIANSIKLENGSPMFDVLEQEYCLHESINSKENAIRYKLRNTHHIVYHSTTAKNHLNWIEYIFWAFLQRVHNELNCEIIISLHYDERARESGLQNSKEQDRYNRLFESYSKIAKKIIGENVTVLDEKDFHSKTKYAKFYAYTFHNKFVKSIIQYVKQVINGDLDYKSFMRKISYIESVFPIMALSKSKMKHSRLYVLDRELAQEVWQQSPFLEFKNSYGIYFITAQTIKDPEGKPIRIFSPEDTINITDNYSDIIEKLKQTDEITKKTMFHLLSISSDNLAHNRFRYSNEISDELIASMIIEIQNKYKLCE